MATAQACELDAWNAKASAFVRDLQKANPELPYREVDVQLRKSRPALMAEARAQCAAKPR